MGFLLRSYMMNFGQLAKQTQAFKLFLVYLLLILVTMVLNNSQQNRHTQTHTLNWTICFLHSHTPSHSHHLQICPRTPSAFALYFITVLVFVYCSYQHLWIQQPWGYCFHSFPVILLRLYLISLLLAIQPLWTSFNALSLPFCPDPWPFALQ